MTKRRLIARTLTAIVAVLAVVATAARAEEVDKKFRIAFAVGGYNTQTEVRSDAANTLSIFDNRGDFVDFFTDPRNDSAVLGSLRIEPATRMSVAGQYAFNRHVLLEASVGYQKGDVGDIEMQAWFQGEPPRPLEDFGFDVFPAKAGELTQVPLQLTTIVRFRPKAAFNPYLGAGVGYTLVGFDTDPELDALSRNMDGSVGGQAVLAGFPGSRTINGATTVADLRGATVTAPDTFEWHVVGGMEYGFKKGWAAFVDLRYLFASRSFELTFNGERDFGVSVPENIAVVGEPSATAIYGPIQITQGGLIDAGSIQPRKSAPPTTDCALNPELCEFARGAFDGQLDPGFYYVKGGAIKYGGASLQVGIKYTF